VGLEDETDREQEESWERRGMDVRGWRAADSDDERGAGQDMVWGNEGREGEIWEEGSQPGIGLDTGDDGEFFGGVMSWVPISSNIIESSLWDEEDWVIKIFLTMLAGKGAGDIYSGSAYGLARASRKTEEEVLAAWKILSSPDSKRIERQAHGGARIQEVEGGWFIINAEY